MMLYRNVLNFLRGSVQVEIECACPERVLNLCAVEEIAFWDLQWLSPIALRLRVTRRGWHALRSQHVFRVYGYLSLRDMCQGF